MAAVHDLHEPDVGALRESRVVLDRGTEARDRGVGDRGHPDDRMRVADRDRADFDLARAHRERVDVGLAARLEGQGGRVEVRHAHRDRDLVAPDPGLHQAARAVEHELARVRALALLDDAGDAARAVAALLHLAAVGVEDPVIDRGARLARGLEHQRLVEADAGEPVGEAAEGAGGRGA